MSQLTTRLELAAAEMPLFSDWVGRTTVIDDSRAAPKLSMASSKPEPITKPQLIYAENVLPTVHGYRSVAFQQRSSPLPGSRTMLEVWETQDTLQRNAYIAAATDATLWLFTEDFPGWKRLSVPVGWNGTPLTFAIVSGFSFVFVPGLGLYELDGGTRDLVKQTVTGIVDTAATGICGSFGYLVFYDETSIYYSSATNPLDHVPSISTGAGSGAIQEARGAIRFIRATSLGMMIFCEKNVVSAQFSQNIRYPWVFKSVDNSQGVGNMERTASEDETGSLICLTISGLMGMNVKAAKQVFPAVSEFLMAKRFESFNRSTHQSEFTAVPGGLLTRIKSIGSRWLVLSYGISSYTHALVYDSALQRWGKLQIGHIAPAELFIDYSQNPARCSEVPEQASEVFSTCDMIYIGGPATDTDSSTLAFFDSAGRLYVADFSYLADAEALMIFGRVQLTRGKKCTIHEAIIECEDHTDATAFVLSSVNGRSNEVFSTMYKFEAEDSMVKFLGGECVEAESHNLEFRGAFNVVSLLVSAAQGGGR